MLKEAVLGGKNSVGNTAVADLNVLSAQFQRLKIKIRQLIDALKAQHVSLVQINETRFMVAKRISALAEGGEIASQAGTIPTAGEDPNDSYLTYMGIHHSLSDRQKMYSERFLTHVVEYAIEWEKVIVARVSTSLKQAERLRLDQDHYRGKVDNIQRDAGKIISRGRDLDPKLSEKLERNEEKLRNSEKEYETFTSDLCLLMAEVTGKSWKDLHPILLKLIQFDTTLVSDEKKILSNLSSVEGMLKKIAVKHGLKPENRLKDLENLSPTLICSTSTESETAIEKDNKDINDEDAEDAKSMPDLLSQKGSTDSAKENKLSKISEAPSSGNHSSANSILASLDGKYPSKTKLSSKVRSNVSTIKEDALSLGKHETSFQSKTSSSPKGTKGKLSSSKGRNVERKSSSKKSSDTLSEMLADSGNKAYSAMGSESTPTRANSKPKHRKSSSYSSASKSNYKGVKAVVGERNSLTRDSSPTPRARDSNRSQNTQKVRDTSRSREKHTSKSQRKSGRASNVSPFENFLLCGAGTNTSGSYNDDYTVDDTIETNTLDRFW